MILLEAQELIHVQRSKDYEPPDKNFSDIAFLWSVYLGKKITPAEVCIMMALLKVCRLKNEPTHRDSYVDMAGYTGLAAELALKEETKTDET